MMCKQNETKNEKLPLAPKNPKLNCGSRARVFGLWWSVPVHAGTPCLLVLH
jgi:hypothetical protein